MITVNKSVPPSDWYTGTGSTTISLSSVNNITMNSKKSLIKIPVLQSEPTQIAEPSDKGTTVVKDLKEIADTMKIRGWVVDKTDSSAWNQAWQLRGMIASGGPVTSLIVENLTFSSATQQAFLEEVSFIAHPLRAKGLTIDQTSSDSVNIARLEIDLTFFMGDKQ